MHKNHDKSNVNSHWNEIYPPVPQNKEMFLWD